MAKNRMLMVIVILSMLFVCKAFFKCSPGIYQCHLYPWSAWSTCSSSCGEGVSTRFKTICCSLNLMSFSDCAAFCNYTEDDYLDKMVCSNSCLHGVFSQNSCHCPSGSTGKCCQYDPQVEGYTSTITVNRTVNGDCKNGCKFGYCHNDYCVCSTFFKGDICEKPREWFLVIVCMLESFPMLMLFYCLCKRFGKKVAPDNKEHEMM